MRERRLFSARTKTYSLPLHELGLSRPDELKFATWWRGLKVGRRSGLLLGMLGGGLAYFDHQGALPNAMSAIFKMFGEQKASKVVDVFLSDILSQHFLLTLLLSLTFLVGLHRVLHGGVTHPVGRVGKVVSSVHIALQNGLAAVAFCSLAFGLVALATGSWIYALKFALVSALTFCHCAVTWFLFRFMFIFSDRDHGLRSRLMGVPLMACACAMPWALEYEAIMETHFKQVLGA